MYCSYICVTIKFPGLSRHNVNFRLVEAAVPVCTARLESQAKYKCHKNFQIKVDLLSREEIYFSSTINIAPLYLLFVPAFPEIQIINLFRSTEYSVVIS